MSGGGGSDMSANAWPGFVDILSAVVIMFVFFVLITAAVLYFYTITYKAKIEGQAAPITEESVQASSSRVEELERENRELRERIESAEPMHSNAGGGVSAAESTTTEESVLSFGEQASEQEIMTSDDGNSLVIFHDPGAVTVDEGNVEKINAFLEEMASRHGAEKIEVVVNSPKAKGATTQGRAKRLSVARMLNVRNSLLDTPVKRENIKVNVVESEVIEDSENWTRLTINILE